MPINHALLENNITAGCVGSDDYAAIVHVCDGADGGDLVEGIIRRAEPDSALREAVRGGTTAEKVGAVRLWPTPDEHCCIGSTTNNDTVMVGPIGQLSGSRLRFEPTEPDEGLCFVADAGGETEVAGVPKNKASKVVGRNLTGGRQP